MIELPENVVSGDVARLFPVIAETGKEQRATSILLAVMSAVPPFAEAILSQFGQRVGVRSTINTFTEVVFKNEGDTVKQDRPDGLLELATGKKQVWACLFEAKIGKADLGADQIERYMRLAKDNNIQAVVTISNQFAPVPTHHPLGSIGKKIKKVELFHISWGFLLTEAIRLHEQALIDDPEQAFLIREFVRFFSHQSAGVTGFTSMPTAWPDAVQKLKAGGRLAKSDGSLVVAGWYQETRDLTLQLSQFVGRRVEERLSRKHSKEPEKRLADDTEILCKDGVLSTTMLVPDAVAPLDICADLKTRSIRVGMTVDAPRDKVRSSARLNWLLRQIKDVDTADIYIGLVWASRAATTVFTLKELQEDPKTVDRIETNSEIRAFEITLVSSDGRRFGGPRTFIDEIETLLPRFYSLVGQHLSAWQAPAPKAKKDTSAEDPIILKTNEAEKQTKGQEGNDHTALLEIPDFLAR